MTTVYKQIAEKFEELATLFAQITEGAIAEEKTTKSTKTTKTTSKDSVKEEEEVVEDEGYSLSELNGMKVTELRAIADELGVEYDAKKTRKADLIDLIMEQTGDQEEEGEEVAEETDDDLEGDVTIAEIVELDFDELKEFAKENEVKFTKATKHDALLDKVISALFDEDEIEAYEESLEEEEEDSDGEDEITAESLAEMDVEEVREIAKGLGIKVTKFSKADKLIPQILEALEEDGEDDEETIAGELGLDEMDEEELAEILEEYELSTTGKKQALISRIVKAVQDGVIAVGEWIPEKSVTNKEVFESEVYKSVRPTFLSQYGRTLKDSHIKNFLKNYYDGNPLAPVNGNSKKDMLESYITIHENLVGDDLQKHELSEVYELHGRKHCCGKLLTSGVRKGYQLCEVCGTEYKK